MTRLIKYFSKVRPSRGAPSFFTPYESYRIHFYKKSKKMFYKYANIIKYIEKHINNNEKKVNYKKIVL
jgi:hypothetical protein